MATPLPRTATIVCVAVGWGRHRRRHRRRHPCRHRHRSARRARRCARNPATRTNIQLSIFATVRRVGGSLDSKDTVPVALGATSPAAHCQERGAPIRRIATMPRQRGSAMTSTTTVSPRLSLNAYWQSMLTTVPSNTSGLGTATRVGPATAARGRSRSLPRRYHRQCLRLHPRRLSDASAKKRQSRWGA